MDDQAYFRELFERNYPAVARYAHNRGHRGPDAEDLIAATFEVAWRRLELVPAGEEATPWLLGLARNHSRNADRRSRSRRRLIDSLTEPDEVLRTGGVEERVIARDQLLAALTALKETDRELILLVAWDGLDPAQAGHVMGLRPGAARSRLHRARNRLAVLLGRQAGQATSRRSTAASCVTTPQTKQESAK
jgi:RNA polymerase sigma-70 factor (ECF subfamily)